MEENDFTGIGNQGSSSDVATFQLFYLLFKYLHQ